MLTKDDANVIRQIVKEELNPVNKKLSKLQKDLDTTINFFDTPLLSNSN